MSLVDIKQQILKQAEKEASNILDKAKIEADNYKKDETQKINNKKTKLLTDVKNEVKNIARSMLIIRVGSELTRVSC